MNGEEYYRYAEKCLYDYKKNLACLEILREDLRVAKADIDVHAQNYQYTLDFTGDPSDPVHGRMMRIENIEERIRILERFTQPVTRLIQDLTAPYIHEGSEKAEMYSLMELYYFGQNSITVVMSKLNMSRTMLYFRRQKLVKMAMGYMGYVFIRGSRGEQN